MINIHAYFKMQVLCMNSKRNSIAQWHVNLNFPVEPQICSYMYTYLVLAAGAYILCYKCLACSMRWTQSKPRENVLPVSSKGNHSLHVHCCILGYKLGTHHSEINFKCSILQNNKIMCLIYCANICYLSAKRLKERDH